MEGKKNGKLREFPTCDCSDMCYKAATYDRATAKGTWRIENKRIVKNKKKKRALVKKQIWVRLLDNEKSSLVVVHYTLKDILLKQIERIRKKRRNNKKKVELIFNKLFDTLQ